MARLPNDAELRGEEDPFAVGADEGAEEYLVLAVSVQVGGVEHGDARVEGGPQGFLRLGRCARTVELTEAHAAQALGAY